MEQNRLAHEPLLYIHQPNITKPKVMMQAHYISHNISKKNQQTEVENLEKINVDEEKKEIETEDLPFKEMTILDKVHYLLNREEHLPKLICEVETKERKYRGMVSDFKDQIVYLRTGQRYLTVNDIPFADIIQISLVGFMQ